VSKKFFKNETTPETGAAFHSPTPPASARRSERSPVDGLLAGFLQQLVRLREMPTAKKPSVDGERRGMRRLQDVVAFLQSVGGRAR